MDSSSVIKKVLIGILLYILIPAGVAALGFFVVGPRLGSVPVLVHTKETVENIVKKPEPTEPEPPKEVEKPKAKLYVEEATGKVSRRNAKVETLIKGKKVDGLPDPDEEN